MQSDVERLHFLSLKGYCCAQIMIILGLEALDMENPQLIDVMSALCSGVRRELICGALTGAACMLSLFDKNLANKEMIPALVSWFKQQYPCGINCSELIDNDPANKPLVCPKIIENTYLKGKEILQENGFTI